MGACLSSPSTSLSGPLDENIEEGVFPVKNNRSLSKDKDAKPVEILSANSSFKLPELPKSNSNGDKSESKPFWKAVMHKSDAPKNDGENSEEKDKNAKSESEKPKKLEYKGEFVLEKRKSYIKRDENPSQIYKIPSQSKKGTTSAGGADTFSLPMISKPKKTIFSNENDPTRSKGRKGDDSIGIACFEVANIIARALNLHSSLLEKDLDDLQEQVLEIEGIKLLVSDNLRELWKIVAFDKRKELMSIAKEVARLGKLSSDPKFHILWENFLLLGTDKEKAARRNDEDVLNEIQLLETQANTTSELYHEITTFDSIRQNYLKKGSEDEENLTSNQKATLNKLKKDLKNHEAKIALLKATGLWTKKLDTVLENLEELIAFLYHQIVHVFENRGVHALPFNYTVDESLEKNKLGVCGLSLHYANIINLIDNLVSRPMIIPQTRENLYHMLPIGVKQKLKKSLLNSKNLQTEKTDDLRDKLEETLDWLATMAGNTLRFGADFRLQGHTELTELQTLHHADKEKTEDLLIELIIGLQHLASRNTNVLDKSQLISSPIPRLPTVAPIPAAKVNSVLSQQGVLVDGNESKTGKQDIEIPTSLRENGGENIWDDDGDDEEDEEDDFNGAGQDEEEGKGSGIGGEERTIENPKGEDESRDLEQVRSSKNSENEVAEASLSHLFLPPKRLAKVNTKKLSMDESDSKLSPLKKHSQSFSPSVKPSSNSSMSPVFKSRHKKSNSKETLMKQEMLSSLPKDELERIEVLAYEKRTQPFISHSMEHVRMDANAAKLYAKRLAERKKSQGFLPNVHLMDVVKYLPDGQPVQVFSPRLTRSLSRSHTYSSYGEEDDEEVYSRIHFVKPMTPHNLDVDRIELSSSV